MTKTTDRDPSTIHSEIVAKSKMIHHQQSRADRGEFKSMGDALLLQKTKRERQRLMDELPPLRLVVDNTE